MAAALGVHKLGLHLQAYGMVCNGRHQERTRGRHRGRCSRDHGEHGGPDEDHGADGATHDTHEDEEQRCEHREHAEHGACEDEQGARER